MFRRARFAGHSNDMTWKQTLASMPAMDTITLGVSLITACLIGLFAYVDRQVGSDDGGSDFGTRPQTNRDHQPGPRP